MPNLRSKARLEKKVLNENSISFIIELDSVVVFTSGTISGLGIETQVVEYMDGDNQLTFKRPGRFTYKNITIHNIPIAEKTPLYDWAKLAIDMGGNGSPTKSLTIRMMEGTTEIKRWNCFGCFPASYTFHTMEPKKALYADMVIAVEKFEIE